MSIFENRALRRKQLDRSLGEIKALRQILTPAHGWIAEIRRIIGMRSDQLAARMNVAQSTASAFERAEADGTITLNSLRRAAAAMDCRLVYAFVPDDGSFEGLVQRQAEHEARATLRPINHTMNLEDQATGAIERDEIVHDYINDLVRRLPRELWDEAR